MKTWFRRVWHLINRRRFERELVDEMREHRAAMNDPSDFGDTHRLLERSRDAWGWNWLDDAAQDLSVGVRALVRSPSYAVTATLILAFGIGLNLTLYRLASVALLRPPAIDSPGSMARFYRQEPHGSSSSLPYPLTQFVKDHNSALSAVLVESSSTVAWGADADEEIELSLVSTNWFHELGYAALHGRVFSDDLDGRADSAPVALLGYHFWRTRLGGDPAVVGSTVMVERRPFTVIGITPERLPGLDFDVPAVYVPITQRGHLYPASTLLTAWDQDSVAMYGRLRPGFNRVTARESLRAIMRAAAEQRPEIRDDEWLEPHMGSVNFMDDRDRAGAWAVLALLAGLTALVLVVAAANLGNLVLSRATGRVREFGVRMALGARRGRIVRQLVMESVPLALAGVVGSIVFSGWIVHTIVAVTQIPPYLDFGVDTRTVLASVALAAVALLAIGVLPAWKVAQQELTDALKDGGHGVSRVLDRAFLRRILLAAQVAGSCLLLVVAGLMVRGIQRVVRSDLGFDYAQAAVLSMPLGRYGITGDAVIPYWYGVKDRVLSNPEVESAAIVTAPPLGGRVYERAFTDAPKLEALQQSIDPEYFALMRIPLLAGRVFQRGDDRVVIVSRRLAQEMYGSLDVLGRGFPRTQPTDTIIGVAADAHTIKVNATNVAELYRPLRPEDFGLVYLVVRARADPARLVPVLREAAAQDPRVIPAVRLMRNDFDRRVRGSRVAGAVAAAIGGLTLLLACLGIFGVVSYGVALRTKEIGIRSALGADRGVLLRAILTQVLGPVAAGVAAGVAAAVPAALALSGDPFYLQLVDPQVFLAALTIFLCAAFIAAAWPALRALDRNVVDALRHP
jgi:predicted permease